MESITESLSVLHSPSLSSNLFGLNYKQIRRTYPGDYTFNFVIGLSSCNDFTVKNYTNFYLTNRMKVSDIFDIEDDKVKVDDFITPISFGGTYLYFDKVNENYGLPLFSSEITDSNIHLDLFGDNQCHIYHIKDYKRYYLVCDNLNDLYFVRERYLTFDDDTINPQDFVYLFSEDEKKIFFFKDTATQNLFLTNEFGVLVTTPIVDDNILSYLAKPFTIDRNLYFDPTQSLDMSFITYNIDNTVNSDKSLFDLTNNFLLHKKYSVKHGNTDIMLMKNQLLVDDVFSSANSLLSSGDTGLYVNNLREYTSIFDDIKEETTSELELNYVFYNQSYKIKPGSNTFISPSSMYPFAKLNINDSKFIPSGAFSYITPEFSDKVYHVSNEPQNSVEGQYLLCTWLSGSPLGTDKVWVDRYYYPDLIEKDAAIAAKPYQYPTYDDYIEDLIRNNASLQETIAKQKIFDKLSDFVFEPTQTYIYERISQSLFTPPPSTVNFCDSVSTTYPKNYFKDLNEAGKFTFSTFFKGDNRTWTLSSDRNAINSGVNIVKSSNSISISYTLFDPSTQTYQPFSITTDYKAFKENFLSISVDSIAGVGYFCVNNNIILSFTIPQYQYTIKRLLYGDFFVVVDGVKHNVLAYGDVVYDPIVTATYTPPEFSFTLPLISGKSKIEDIYITLPCGMRNGSDNIAYLQQLCNASAFKSNNINILVKNLNIDNQSVLQGVEDTIISSIRDFIPANSKVNNITFINFK